MCCALLIWPKSWTPEPVPKSKTECTGVVGVVRRSDRLAAPTPSTWSGFGMWSTTDASTSEKTQRLAPSITWERISSAMRTTPLALVCATLASTSLVARTGPTALANSVAGIGSCNRNNLMSKSIWLPLPVATSTAAGSPRYKASVACGPRCAAIPCVLKPASSKTSTNSGARTCNGISGLSGGQKSVIYSSLEESGDGEESGVASEERCPLSGESVVEFVT